ncbi:hypothetical protein ACFVDI_03630 [Nocardioides sp. NPDC057767]|uniref:hypothetical protein n=1 Tax=unclassified Nocardioides TaxID=2615069 RepID=UPI003670CDE5
MAVTYEQLQSWKPEELDTAADQLNTARKSFQDQQDEMDAGKVPSTWIGEAATRAENRHRRLVADLNDIAAPLSQVINALDEAAASIKKAKDNAKHAYDDAIGRGWKVTFSGGVQITDPAPDEKDPDKDKGTMQQLAQNIQDALTDAESADADLTAVLNHATKGDYDGGDGTIEQASLPPELRNLPEEELINKMLSDPGKYDGYIDALPPDAQERLGKEISDRLDSTLNDDDYKLSKEEADRLNAMLSAYTDDSTVAAGLYKDLGADGTVASMARIEEYLRMQSPDSGSLNTLASNLRSGLASASNDPGFPAEKFGHDIVKYAGPSGVYLSNDEQDALRDRYPNWGGTGGASVLAYLMKDHDLNGDLVLGAAEELDKFEQADGPLGAKTWYHHTGHGPLGSGENGYGADPMAAIMGNLGDHPEQGYEFFTEDESRQKFYFNDRTWEADGYAGISQAAAGISTDPELVKENPEGAAMIASRFVDYVADSEGFNAEDAKPASPYVSEILKNYMHSVDDALHARGEDGEAGVYTSTPVALGDIANSPRFFANDIESLLKVGASTQDGLVNLAEGVGTYQQSQINNAAYQIQQNPGDYRDGNVLSDVMQHSAYLNGAVEHAIGSVEIEGAANTDKQIQTFTSLVGDVAGMVPLPGTGAVGTVVEFGVGQAIDLATDKADGHFANFEEAATDHANDRAAASLNESKVNALDALVKSGVVELTPEHRERFFPEGQPVDLSKLSDEELGDLANLASNRYLNEYGMGSIEYQNAYGAAFREFYE